MPEIQKQRLTLMPGSLMYRDARLSGYEAAAVVEVIEHLDPSRRVAFERVLFECARPATVVLTTPNRDYNAAWATLPADVMTKLLGRRWGRPMEETTLAALVAADDPPPVLPRPPFNRNGLDPCDELCVAGFARVVPGGDRVTFSGQVLRAASR